MAGIRLFVFVHDFNHRINWHIFNEPGKREQQCCSEHGRVNQISCHSLVWDLTAHVYVVVCLLCHAFEEARGVCSRRQRDSGVGGNLASFGKSVPESNDCQHRGGLKGRNKKTDVKKRADASDGLNLHRLSCSLTPIKNTTRTSLPYYFQHRICCVGARANTVKLSPDGRHRLQQVILHKCLPSFSRSMESLSE